MNARTLAEQFGYPTMEPIRRKQALPYSPEAAQTRRDAERERKQSRRQERTGKRSQAFV